MITVDVPAVAAVGARFSATAAELTAIASVVERSLVVAAAIQGNLAFSLRAVHVPALVARAVLEAERAAVGTRILAAGYVALASDAAGQVAAITADTAAGSLVGVGLRAADIAILAGGRLLAESMPEGPGQVRDVPAPPPLPPAPTLADLYGRIASLAPGEMEVAPVLGADGAVRYVVLLRGMEPSLNPTLNTPAQAVRSSRLPSDSYSRAVAAAMERAGVPPGSEVMLVGHSQGGITALNVAAAGAYRVTHVVVAGAPIANKRAPDAQVLAIEHQGDLVPELDGTEEPSNSWRTGYRFGAAPRLSHAAAGHGLRTGYLPELADARFAADPGVRAYLDSAAPYLRGRPGPSRRFRLDAGPMPWAGGMS